MASQSLISRIIGELSTIFLFLLPAILVIVLLKNFPESMIMYAAYWFLIAVLIYLGYMRFKKSPITHNRYFAPVLYGISFGCFIAGGYLVSIAPDMLAEIYIGITLAAILFALGLYNWLKWVLG